MFEFEHAYLTVIGDCYTGTEKWQFGLRALNIAVPSSSNQAIALAAAPIVQNWWLGTGYVSPNDFQPMITHRLTELKVAQIGLDGSYLPNTVAYSHFYLPPVAAGNPSTLAGQSAQQTMCATLYTGKPRGLASKGRIYLPPSRHMQVNQADGKLISADALGLAKSVQKLITDLNALAELGPVMVMSRGKGVRVDNPAKHRWDYTYPNPGTSNAVTGVRMGRVIDTQRRRRRQLVESPEVAAL